MRWPWLLLVVVYSGWCERKGDRLRLHAQVCRSAAAEIEARDCPTVGEANKSAVVRAMRKALRMQDGGGS